MSPCPLDSYGEWSRMVFQLNLQCFDKLNMTNFSISFVSYNEGFLQ